MAETVVTATHASVGTVTDRSSPKGASVWHNFRGIALERMRIGPRAHHPSRQVVDDLMFRWFDRRPFEWLDVGVVGMVDYERLRSTMAFRFTGVDLSESVLEDSRRYLRRPDDDLVRWDVEDALPDALRGRYDLVTLRHVLNHCAYYERPLEHVAAALRPGGRVVLVLHLALVDGPDQLRRHRRWDVAGEVIGNRYGRERFLAFLGGVLTPELWIRVDDGVKPNDVIVARERPDPAGRALRPYRLWMPPGRRNAPTRAISMAALRWRTRGLFRT